MSMGAIASLFASKGVFLTETTAAQLAAIYNKDWHLPYLSSPKFTADMLSFIADQGENAPHFQEDTFTGLLTRIQNVERLLKATYVDTGFGQGLHLSQPFKTHTDHKAAKQDGRLVLIPNSPLHYGDTFWARPEFAMLVSHMIIALQEAGVAKFWKLTSSSRSISQQEVYRWLGFHALTPDFAPSAHTDGQAVDMAIPKPVYDAMMAATDPAALADFKQMVSPTNLPTVEMLKQAGVFVNNDFMASHNALLEACEAFGLEVFDETRLQAMDMVSMEFERPNVVLHIQRKLRAA
jgi:hypothetical protein